MDDFEYSVEICDRDWEGFFAETEECNLLPPSLAGVDDSGMSDIDDTGSCLAQEAQRIDPTQDSSENEHHIDDTIEYEGSPVEHCLTKHGIGGLDSILSGSEEDLHLQSVNIFFERLKSVTEAEPSQERVGNKAIQEEEHCGNGQQASRNYLLKNFPKSNTLPARSETALGTETMRPVGTSGNLKTKEKIKAESNISSDPAAFSNSKVKSCKPSEIELFIKEKPSRETGVNEVTQWNQSHDSTNSVICSEKTPQSFSVEMCRSLDEQEGLLTSQVILRKKSGTREDYIPNQESSPSSFLRKKKKKKRRLSVEAGQACERQALVKQTDSEEEQHASREGAGLCLSEESLHLNAPQKNLTYLPTPYSNTSNLPVDMSANQIENGHLPNVVLRRRCTATGLAENNLTNHKTASPMSQNDDNVMLSASNGTNDATLSQLCSKPQVEKSPGLFGNENRNHVVKAGDLQQCDKMNTSANGCENEQYQNYSPAEVKSVSLLPSAESCAPPVEVSQYVKQSAAKSVLAAEAENSGKDKSMLCQSELQQQLERDCPDTNQRSRTLENAHFSASTIALITSHTLDAKSSPLEISDEVIGTNLTSDCINQPHDKSYVPTNLSSLDPEQQTDHPMVKTSDISSEKNIRNPSEASQKLVLTSNSQTETKLSLSEDLLMSPSDITHVSSCCTLDTDSVMSFSNENLTDMSLSYSSSASEHESGSQGEKKVPILVKQEQEDFSSGPESKPECKCDILGEAEDAITASKPSDEPEKMENSGSAMSSFWREMEKLTINDILGLRNISKASLPPVQESEETDIFAVCDPGNFTQNHESKQTEQTTEETSVIKSYSSRSEVTWDSEPVPVSHGGIIYPVNTLLASVTDTSEPVLSERAQKCLKKISKAISVHNLQALESESFSYARKGEPLQTFDESESVKFEDFTGDCAPKIDKDVKSLPSSDSYSISLTDIFQYLFGGKQSVPHHSATDDISTLYTGGNSVPETYDHFFSEFDTENFFYPLITAEEKKQDKTVPIFSCSRSAGRNLQFPEAYEYFFASSSSDDSSVESDEEDNCPPVRIVSRFSRKESSAEINTDIYEDFFTDTDFRDQFFCLKSLSFRNIKFSASNFQKQRSNSVSLVPVRRSCRSTLRADPHLNALGNPDVMVPDPLLYHLDERISRQLAQQPFIYEDLQATISNPGLDAPLMALKQSDMCLVCIAFASWVLKTANPQVGDAWKAVLLANISALSAIRYLRKYVKVEAATNETKLHYPALTYP